jgi:hypothetical protein
MLPQSSWLQWQSRALWWDDRLTGLSGPVRDGVIFGGPQDGLRVDPPLGLPKWTCDMKVTLE